MGTNMSKKPWLAAKTAGEALAIAEDNVPHRGIRHRNDDLSAAVIEWHEAQRVKVSERWGIAVESQREDVGAYEWGIRYPDREYAQREVVDARALPGCVRATVVKVTRYRRKPKVAKR